MPGTGEPLPELQPEEAQKMLDDALFVDVREPYEFEAGHIDGSLHMPIGQVAHRWEELPRDRTIVAVCQVGQRSELVANFLAERGLAVHNLAGGLSSWSQQGLPLTSVGTTGEVVDGYARDMTGTRLNPDL